MYKWTISFILCAVLYIVVPPYLSTLTVPLCVRVYLCECVNLKRTYSEDITPAGWLRERVDERVCTIGSRIASKRVYLCISI